jgi:hypothetical protein
VTDAPDDVRELIARWSRWRAPVVAAAAHAQPTLSPEDVRWLPPVIPGKLRGDQLSRPRRGDVRAL